MLNIQRLHQQWYEMMNKINLGKLGETDFVKWCTQAGLTTNSSKEEDVNGWDYIVEFPFDRKDNTPTDKLKPPIECKVQVKSTQRNDKRLGIKLSVLQRLANYIYPAFILFIKYDKHPAPNALNVYIVHIDDKVIKRVLKRLRENDLLTNPKGLNQIQLSISYNDSHKLDNISGSNIKHCISSYVGNCISEYQNNKKKLLNNLGYENGGISLTFNTNILNKQKFIDMSLGLTKSINVENFIVKDERFNLRNDKYIIAESNSGKLSIKPENSQYCTLKFKTGKYSPSISFNAELIPLPINPVLPDSEKVLSFKTPLFSIALDGFKPGKNTAKIYFTLGSTCSLSEIISTLKLFSNSNSAVNLILEIDGLKNGKVTSNINFKITNPFEAEFGYAIENICNSFGIDKSTDSNLHLLEQEKSNTLLLNKLTENDLKNSHLETEEPIFGEPKEIVYLESILTCLGKVIVGGIFGLYAEKEHSTKYIIYRAELITPICSYESISSKELESILDESIQRFDDDDLVCVTRN